MRARPQVKTYLLITKLRHCLSQLFGPNSPSQLRSVVFATRIVGAECRFDSAFGLPSALRIRTHVENRHR